VKTPLYDLHLELGAKMTEFAGYELPVNYPGGIIKEHLHTRSAASLFDVSHMGQIRLSGAGAARALERLVPGDIVGLDRDRQRYSLLTNEAGGIRDDLMVANFGEHLMLVVNAACKQDDYEYIEGALGGECTIELLTDRALLALQGPAAVSIVTRLSPAVAVMRFMDAVRTELKGIEVCITRSGYTGEDGFEISVAAEQAASLARCLLGEAEVEAAGLGARDSLRLEAGLCLYGHDIDEHTSPLEADIGWVIARVRRAGGERAGGFPGSQHILEEFDQGVTRKRVGLRPEGKAPVREGTALVDVGDDAVGTVTSGGFGPTLEGACAMGYVEAGKSRPGTVLQAVVRGKTRALTVVPLPFVPHRYAR